MQASALARVASASPQWLQAWSLVRTDFRQALGFAGLDDPLIWSRLRGNRSDLEDMFMAMGLLNVDGEQHTYRLDTASVLQAAAAAVF